jgi:hypothetical protein
VGAVSQVVDNSSKLLQGFQTSWVLLGFPDELDPSLQLKVERCFQVVVTVVSLKHLSNFFVCRSSRDDM